MAITINGKTYRNLQEQVEENVKDIEDLQDRPISYSKEESDAKYQTKSDMTDYYDKTESDAKFQTKADMSDYYDKTESDAKFQTKIGMALYATQQQLNLNIAATEARTDLLLANKQDTLVSGTNIKTINGNSLVGSGNIQIEEGGSSYTAGTGIDITNSVISVDNSVLTTSTAAEVAMTGSYSDLSNTPNLATVATSGAYNDLSGKPILATVATTGNYGDLSNTPNLATVATSGAYNDLSGKPNLATVATTGNYSDLIGKPTEHTYYCSMKIVTTDNKTYVFSKYFTTTEAVLPTSGPEWWGTDMLKYIRYGGSVWFCQTTADGTNIPVQTLVYADYMEDVDGYRFRAYNNSGHRNDFVLNISKCNVYIDEL